MVTIDDLFIINKAFRPQIIAGFEFYTLPRINGKKQKPSYLELALLSSRKVSAEKLLDTIGAEKTFLKVFNSNALLPLILPHNNNNKLTCFDFAAIQQNAEYIS